MARSTVIYFAHEATRHLRDKLMSVNENRNIHQQPASRSPRNPYDKRRKRAYSTREKSQWRFLREGQANARVVAGGAPHFVDTGERRDIYTRRKNKLFLSRPFFVGGALLRSRIHRVFCASRLDGISENGLLVASAPRKPSAARPVPKVSIELEKSRSGSRSRGEKSSAAGPKPQ